ncbi:hypothetical protein AB0J80_29150 [Actinoplanes sp. NPDC049548]|uniref:hypothetical protein n=1 Tax=Actinoplanes sp. NPDC049548 TaxID=3155152 RepID=UPI0034416079
MPVIADPGRVREIDVIEIAPQQSRGWDGRTAVRGAVVATWHGEAARTALALVTALPEAEQERCFLPRYAVRLRSGPTVLAEIAFCFRCRNAGSLSFEPDFVIPGRFTFDPDSGPARQLLALFTMAAGDRDAGPAGRR